MRRYLAALTAAVSILAMAPFGACLAQQASASETAIIDDIVQCLARGLPEDWVRAQMTVELKRPGDETGSVRYLVFRKEAPDMPENFRPCDSDEPPLLLIGMRAQQPPERQGWTSARLVLERDGSFRLNYDFPK